MSKLINLYEKLKEIMSNFIDKRPNYILYIVLSADYVYDARLVMPISAHKIIIQKYLE